MHQNITELTTSDPYPIVSNDNGKIELVTSSSKIVDDSTQKTQYKYEYELHKYKIGESGKFILDEKFKIHNNQNAALNTLSNKEKNHLLDISKEEIKKLLNDKVNACIAERNEKLQQKEATEVPDFKEIHRHGDKSLRRAKVVSQKGRKYEIQIWHGQTLNAEFETNGNQNTALNKLSDEEKNNLLGMSAKAIKKLLNDKLNAYVGERNKKLQQKEAAGKLTFHTIYQNEGKSLLRAKLKRQNYRIQIWHGQTLNAKCTINKHQNTELNKILNGDDNEEKNKLLDMSWEEINIYLSKKYKESRKLPSLPSKKNLNDNKSKKARLGAQQDNPLYFLAAVDSDVALGEQKTLSNDTHKSQDNGDTTTRKRKNIDDLCKELANKKKIKTDEQDNGDTTTNLSKELGNNPQTKLANPNIKSANSSECPSR